MFILNGGGGYGGMFCWLLLHIRKLVNDVEDCIDNESFSGCNGMAADWIFSKCALGETGTDGGAGLVLFRFD